jgi:O-antigen/teichoic acid export membrane protein
MATGEQYSRLAINFALIATMSRLLTPPEIGVSVIGIGIVLIAQGLREFATSDVLIRSLEVRHEDVRTSFSVQFLLTALIAGAIFAVAPWIGAFYGEELLAQFLRIAAFAGLLEALAAPIIGLLRRDMEFGKLAFVNSSSVLLNATTTVLLGLLGFSYLSFAWGVLAAGATMAVTAFYFRPDLSIYRPAFHSWRNVLHFGGYNGLSLVINRIYESLPQLVLGHLLPHAAVGVYNRANVVSDIPDKIILQSVLYVAFPALAAEVRQGNALKAPYLRALSYITVFYWPAQILLIALAHPIVMFLLGEQWGGVVPLLQILGVASFAWFPVILTAPVLLAVGAIRDRMMADLIGRAVSTVVLCACAPLGVIAMAASKLFTLPFQMLVGFRYIRRHVPFRWEELAAALWKSAAATTCSAVGPAIVVMLSNTGFELSAGAVIVAAFLAIAGWSVAVLTTRHPILYELGKATQSLSQNALAQQLGGRIIAWSAGAGR